MRMVMVGIFLLLGLVVSPAVVLVHGQPGFISIDCGLAEGSGYKDDETTIDYSSDTDFIEAGVNKNISSSFISTSLQRQLLNLRSFPDGSRNCYTIKPVEMDSKYLIRASFMYGNYDGLNLFPQFDLYLGVNLWDSVNLTGTSGTMSTEIITISSRNFMSVCLVNTGLGTPFISTLELRLMDMSLYNLTTDDSDSLVLYKRLDVGSTTGQIVRYPNDTLDFIWSPYNLPSWTSIFTLSEVKDLYGQFSAPSMVMSTAVRPANESSDTLNFSWTTDNPSLQFHVVDHYAELEVLKENEVRDFMDCGTGVFCYGPFSPDYLVADAIYTKDTMTGQDHYSVSVIKANDSTLPPILNAIEIYALKRLPDTATNNRDVDAIMNIKATYRVKRNWMGDPCLPKNYTWEGLNCSYDSSYPPTIISLDLSSTRLSGEIAPSLGNLTSIQFLDLSRNNLTGAVPDFLVKLSFLTFLNLSSNKLNGSVPSALLERSQDGSLILSFGDNPNLCTSYSCNTTEPCLSGSCKKKHKKFVIPVIAALSVAAVLVIFTALIAWRKFREKRQGEPAANANKECSFLIQHNRRFTSTEIMRMTNNFQRVLGKGAFGTVYHGQMEDGTEVAIKMLSQIRHGSVEFQTEAQLLMRVYHKNLVSFIGYCAEGDNKALILEYMLEGNLAKHLSDKNARVLNWGQRLQIALDVAQGLEYLHFGCKPPIIHRDVKAANILLNERLEAKIADFGLSKAFLDEELTHISTAVKGTHGYLDPEYFNSSKLNEKSDVYSFGVVLFELITGQPAIIQSVGSERTTIVNWVAPMIEIGDIKNVVDPRLHGDYDISSGWKAIEIAIACTPPKSIGRPNMSDVVAELKECLGIGIAPERTTSVKSERPENTFGSMSYPSARW
ncbi:putative LRR receptor-like serine/threonine-protein kinase At1g05700 isoform X2 [Tasmannia lanceolata]|uniref:putative LRR receptor-like serine/threonine-protein kinase At1g05700 isoform X2 n=1 Tax=Tasmannia lanceolata TaxID=3420 RepID=UPI0040644E9E